MRYKAGESTAVKNIQNTTVHIEQIPATASTITVAPFNVEEEHANTSSN